MSWVDLKQAGVGLVRVQTDWSDVAGPVRVCVEHSSLTFVVTAVRSGLGSFLLVGARSLPARCSLSRWGRGAG